MTDRYIKQVLYRPIGPEGQAKLKKSKAAIIGAGGLGSVISICLARSGVGYLRIADSDFLDISNLQRQGLYDEKDLENNAPKAFIAKDKLLKINSGINIEALNIRADENNARDIISGMDIIIDGTDNFESRFVLNKACVEQGIPFIFGAAAGSHGMVFDIIPNETPCLNCIFPEIPDKNYIQSTDNEGILNTLVNVIGSIQATEAVKYITGDRDAMLKELLYIDLWHLSFQSIKINKNRDSSCLVCGFK